jgi:hypothetical protein
MKLSKTNMGNKLRNQATKKERLKERNTERKNKNQETQKQRR